MCVRYGAPRVRSPSEEKMHLCRSMYVSWVTHDFVAQAHGSTMG